jgi:hypothetical protein
MISHLPQKHSDVIIDIIVKPNQSPEPLCNRAMNIRTSIKKRLIELKMLIFHIRLFESGNLYDEIFEQLVDKDLLYDVLYKCKKLFHWPLTNNRKPVVQLLGLPEDINDDDLYEEISKNVTPETVLDNLEKRMITTFDIYKCIEEQYLNLAKTGVITKISIPRQSVSRRDIYRSPSPSKLPNPSDIFDEYRSPSPSKLPNPKFYDVEKGLKSPRKKTVSRKSKKTISQKNKK